MADRDTSSPSGDRPTSAHHAIAGETEQQPISSATTPTTAASEVPIAEEQEQGQDRPPSGDETYGTLPVKLPANAQQDAVITPSPTISLSNGRRDEATPVSTPTDGRRPVLSRGSSQAQTVNSERPRTDSQSTSRTTAALRPSDSGSVSIAIKSLETIAATKEGRKNGPLSGALAKALDALKAASSLAETDPSVVFEALSLATQSSTAQVVTAALDCIGKLMNYSYFQQEDQLAATDDKDHVPLIELVIDAIWKSAGESALPEVQVNVVRALLAAVLNDRIVVHGAGLLKCVRHTYGLTLTARTATTQQVAQSVLMQMIGTIFERAKVRLIAHAHRVASTKESTSHGNDDTASEYATANESSETPTEAANSPVAIESNRRASTQMTLQTFERRASSDDHQIQANELSAPTIITPVRALPFASRTPSGQVATPAITVQTEFSQEELEDEATIKDAYLIFRAMCKLGDKPMAYDDPLALRTKMLNLNIVKSVLEQHHQVFTSPFSVIKTSSNSASVSFTQAVKPYLCLSLSRNGASSVEPLFAISCEVFWLMAKHLRVSLKKELEVFMKEIYFATLDKRSAPPFQKQHITDLFMKMASDGKLLVEMYLNYDCDRAVADNMFQRVIEHVSRQACVPVSVTPEQESAYYEKSSKGRITETHAQGRSNHGSTVPPEYTTKQQSLECLVASLRSMYSWARHIMAETSVPDDYNTARSSLEDRPNHADKKGADFAESVDPITVDESLSREETGGENDYAELERVKQSKTALNEAIRQFNFKPKKGLKALLEHGFIVDDSPDAIAAFFLANDRIDKASLGEYLGEPGEKNVAVMHAFVDQLDFTKTRFVEALRRFLQSFRLPGEAQKIDRLMLKFAERYTNGNPQAFANADTAYVLSYSVIMLNTDQHSSSVKKRMTIEDFIKNNRGINDQENLPDEYLQGIFEEIASNEIVLDTERERAANLGMLPQPPGGLAANIGQALATVGRDLQREAYAQASEAMSNKTEQMFKTLLKSQRRGQQKGSEGRYLEAQSHLHVGPMFEATYISYLTALSGHAQETSNLDAIHLCIEGQKIAMRIACLFDLEHPRRAFAGAFARATSLYNLGEMKPRHVEALKAMIEIANTEGNLLKESWRDILTTISQLDRFQLISTGVREGDIPDVLKGQQKTKTQPTARRRQRSEVSLDSAVAEELGSAEMIRSVDRIFTNTANMSVDAIVQFVEALASVSFQEIQSSGSSEHPRTYSLQKLVEVSDYNMTRVRFEWTRIWVSLGKHFSDVGCHHNTAVVYFALNSLHQLSMRFLEMEELPGFKFQKDFLKPFQHILTHATLVPVKDMVLHCLIQMIQARGQNIRSGWRTMFGVFTAAAKEPHESIVNLAFDNVTQVYSQRFGVVVSQGAFADLIVCLTEFSKNQRFQKKSLQSIEILKSSVSKMLRTPECPLSRHVSTPKDPSQAVNLPKQPSTQTEEEQFWFPVLFAFHDVLMTGEDLEVRSRALTYLFETLGSYGEDFPRSFWDTLWRQLLYPIFMVLKSKSDMSRALNNEELSVWLSTTMIDALRKMIRLYTHFFDVLEYMLERFLKLLALCICQENDTLARIGSNCLQQLTLNNVKKFEPHHWEQIVRAFEELFNRTEATALFSAVSNNDIPSPSLSALEGPGGSDALDLALDNGQKTNKTNRVPSPVSEHHLRLTDGHPSQPPSDAELAVDPLMTPNPNGSGEFSPRKSVADGVDALPQTELESFNPETTAGPAAAVVVTAARRKFFNQIITKCVLQLLMIETVSELFTNDLVYSEIPSQLLLRLMSLLKKSYKFARRFNEDRELRTRLFREGFMRQPPNLLKQESGSASVYINILLRMYADDGAERRASREETEQALIPLCADILTTYIDLDDETQQRNIVTWRPVVVDVLEGYTGFAREEFEKHVRVFAPLAVELMNRNMGNEMQRAVQGVWARVCETMYGTRPRTMSEFGRMSISGAASAQPSPARGSVAYQR